MGLNRKLGNLAQFLDSSASGESITKSATGVGTKAVVSSDIQGSAGTFTFTDSSYITQIISPSYITSKTGKATSLTGIKSMFQGSMPDLIPQTTATYDLGDSAKPLAELILDSSANLFFGSEAFTSILSSGTANNVGGGSGGAAATWYGDRGVFAGGQTSATQNVMQYVDITSTGNAVDFGDLTDARAYFNSGCSNSSRGLFAGSYNASFAVLASIDYITVSTTGNAQDFGDLGVGTWGLAAVSDSTYGVFGGGNSGSVTNVISYVTISSTGNATDFGDLTVARSLLAGANDATRGIFAAGDTGSRSNVMDYITIASTGNATDFGDTSSSNKGRGSASDTTYALFAGGDNSSGTAVNTIDYVVTQTTANATDFGDLNEARQMTTGTSNGTRAIFGGGENASFARTNSIEYVTIQTTGNGTDFGDLLATVWHLSALSGNAS